MPPEFPDAPDIEPPYSPPDAAFDGGPVRRRRSAADAAQPWLLAILVVLLLAASGGLVTAWIVATLRAEPVPAVANATSTPRPEPSITLAPSEGPSAIPSQQPRRTPTPTPPLTQEPEPFVHVVRRGEYLQYIADLYGVTVEDIVRLNDISNPNRIRPGQRLLIPGYGIRPSPTPG